MLGRLLLVAAATAVVLTAALATAASASRVLVLHDDLAAVRSVAALSAWLERRGFVLTHHAATDPALALDRHGERLYDHLLHLAPATKKLGGGLKVTDLLRFVQLGGNLFLAASTTISEPVRDLAAQFGVEYDYPDTAVMDHAAYDVVADAGAHTRLAVPLDHLAPNASAIVSPQDIQNHAPLLYDGIAHATTANPLTMRVLSAGPSAYSFMPADQAAVDANKVKPVDEDPVIAGTDIGLVSCTQTLDNARATFTGSLAMLTDALMDAPVRSPRGTHYDANGNRDFIHHLLLWTFQEKAVVQARRVRHALASSGVTPPFYRVKDAITYEIDLAERVNGTWVPFAPHDMQLELVMLDPYLRTTLEPRVPDTDATLDYATLSTTLKAPDVHGMFKFRVNYKRHGRSFVLAEDVVSVRPLQHNEYPRFLSNAWPYYSSALSMLVGFVVVSAVWMWNMPPAKHG